MAAMMGAATCLAALLAAKRLTAIPGRLVSGLRWKFLAGKAKEKLLSGWVLCSPWIRVMLQIPQVGRCSCGHRVLCTCVPLRKQRVYYHCCACHGPLHITACLPVPMSLDDLRSRQQLREASVAAARKGIPVFSCF